MRLTLTTGWCKMKSDYDKNVVGKRQTVNRQIVAKISDLVERYPDLRFGQILTILNVVDTDNLFNEEPSEILNRVNSIKL